MVNECVSAFSIIHLFQRSENYAQLLSDHWFLWWKDLTFRKDKGIDTGSKKHTLQGKKENRIRTNNTA